MDLLKAEVPEVTKRLSVVSPLWQALSATDKAHYRHMAADNFMKYTVELKKWFEVWHTSHVNHLTPTYLVVRQIAKIAYLQAHNASHMHCELEDRLFLADMSPIFAECSPIMT